MDRKSRKKKIEKVEIVKGREAILRQKVRQKVEIEKVRETF